MELQRDSAESPAAEQPQGKLNKTAFKLFGRRRAGGGGTMPSIFGVRNKGEGKNSGSSNGAAATTTTTGMVRSRTHDGLAEVTLESGGKEEPCTTGEQRLPDPADATGSVAKSHSFLSLLKKNARCEGGRGEKQQQQQHPEPRQKKGLRGLLHSIRWHRRAKAGEESSDSPPDLILPCSLTASLECVQEEVRKPAPQPADAPKDEESSEPEEPAAGRNQESTSPGHSGEEITGKEEEDADQGNQCQLPGPGVQEEEEEEGKDGAITGEIAVNTVSLVEPKCGDSGQERAAPDPPVDPPSARPVDRICLMFADVTSLKSFDSLTGCGDSIADQEEEGGSASGGKNAPGPGKKAVFRKDPILVTYQGGGEEMASPDGVDDDTYLQELMQMLPSSERQGKETEETDASLALETSRCVVEEIDAGTPNNEQSDLDQTPPVKLEGKSEPKTRGKELQQERIPNPEESFDGDAPGSGPEVDSTCSSVQKESTARDSYSGEALLALQADPGKNVREARSEEETSRIPCAKPVVPLATTCSLKTSSGFKESKIPISIKHLPLHPPSQGAETSSNSPLATQQQSTKSEVPRTKIPVSKVLMRRVSNRALTGTSLKATADTAKK
ncbi:APC membrane recruitment protein 2 [Microcaecilia unicolor]|uniref:APC membrane recruitment protein 2 n=1 Tax=Microcaecilia unicolor TaxID=1415580 RepID=A0A6P7XX27_9AMPH|nr:APC membrane recruitment protein 2 [Microcaecilia unicolor]